MTTIVFLIILFSAAVFLIASAARAWSYAKAPIHLRWELYPVPHEEARRVPHGGSRYEEVDHWTKPGHFNFWGELSFMVQEILFLKALHEFNRKMWVRSFPFHFGLYLLIATLGLVALNGAIQAIQPGLAGQWPVETLDWLTRVTGTVGMAMALYGAVALLAARLTSPDLTPYTAAADIFNLVFFLVALGTLAAGQALRPAGSPCLASIVAGLLRWDTTVAIPPLVSAGLILCSLLAAYIPLTHMSHFIGKYFTYHSVRWDDRSNQEGSIQSKVAEYLTYRPRWSAAHVGADGTKTWVDIATANPARKETK